MGNSRAIVELAVFYTCVVAVLDFFLTKIPIVNWLALSLAFIFFTGLLLESVSRLLAKSRGTSSSATRKYEDELDHLETIVEKALAQRQPESIKILEERLRSIVVAAHARQTNQASGQLPQVAWDDSRSITAVAEDDRVSGLLTECSVVVNNSNSQGIERVISKIESWSS
jgi:hypothetical protein